MSEMQKSQKVHQGHKARETELLAIHAVRRVAHRAKVSPALALAIAELSGLIREVRHV
ncbi:hypothetical protein ACFOYU_00160 [Microvirga sp. GCM10011540]|uniref:hypothetical protein n=1 Tax=Microvirga sp. GCM10011540 TaxID=3317338 RepID=UPI0036111DE3